MKARLRPLNEAEAYARCHGERVAEVRIVRIEARRPRYHARITGEDLRRSFEQRLDAREQHTSEGTLAGSATGQSPAARRGGGGLGRAGA
jgi:hypothetical protein